MPYAIVSMNGVPKNAIIKQQKMLLETENCDVEFTDDAIDEIAEIAYISNETHENIGARRLHTVMEKLLEDLSFQLPDPEVSKFTIDREYVLEKFKDTVNPYDLDKYLL